MLVVYHTVFKSLNVIRFWKRKDFLQLFFSDVITSCSFQFSLFVMLWSVIMKALLFMVKETSGSSWHIL